VTRTAGLPRACRYSFKDEDQAPTVKPVSDSKRPFERFRWPFPRPPPPPRLFADGRKVFRATRLCTYRPAHLLSSGHEIAARIYERTRARTGKRSPTPLATPFCIRRFRLPRVFAGPRKGKRRRIERIRGAHERERKGETRGTPFTAQWAPLKPKVMKVSGCLSRSPSPAARFAT